MRESQLFPLSYVSFYTQHSKIRVCHDPRGGGGRLSATKVLQPNDLTHVAMKTAMLKHYLNSNQGSIYLCTIHEIGLL